MIRINSSLSIPLSELTFRSTRSSGPGGQNVNKVDSRVTLAFDIVNSRALDDRQKQRISQRLTNRINRQGVLRISGQEHRTQAANRRAVLNRFAELLAKALERGTPRRPTAIPARSKRHRLEQKKRRSLVKKQRGRVSSSDVGQDR